MSLTKIKGVGEKVAKSITELTGISTLEDFAVIDQDTIQKIADEVPGGPAKVAGWVEQAKGLVDVVVEEEIVDPEAEIQEDEEETTVEDVVEDSEEVEETIEENPADIVVSDVVDDNISDDAVEKLDVLDWFELKGMNMLELGYARSSILIAAASYYGLEKRDVLKNINLSISTKDNLLKAIKGV